MAWPYLPVNPNCTATPCVTSPSTSDLLTYAGPNLPCTGINSCDTLSVSLQKIDEAICELQLAIPVVVTTTSTTTSIPGPVLLSKIVSLSSNDILNLHITPIELLPTLAAGMTYDIISLTATILFNTASYGGGELSVKSLTAVYNPGNNIFEEYGTFSFSGAPSYNKTLPFIKATTASNGLINNDSVIIFAFNQLSTGDSPVKIHLLYREITL